MHLSRLLARTAVPALAGLCLLPGGCTSGTADGSPASVDIALTDVQVVDVVEARLLPGRTVLVDEGRILEVRPPEDSRPLPDAEHTIEGGGRYLIPGLWDAHVHFRGGVELEEENRALLLLYLANGITSVRDAGGDLTEAVLAWRRAIRSGEMTGPRIVTSGPKLDGPRPSWPGSIALSSPDEVTAALDSLEALGTDYVKVYDGSLSVEVFQRIVDEAEDRGRLVTGHMPLSVPFVDAIRRGFDAPDHLYSVFKATSPDHDAITRAYAAGDLGFWPAVFRAMERRDPAREAEVFREMEEAGAAIVPTLHIGDVLARVDVDDHQNDPELRYIAPAIEETYQGRVQSARRASQENRRQTRRLRDMMRDLVPGLRDADVTILAGSDAGPFNSYVYPGFSLHGELEALVEAGLTPAEALRAATVNPSRFLGLGNELGRIEIGYLADLVLLDADPLEDIHNARSVALVVLRGRDVLDREDLEAGLEAIAR